MGATFPPACGDVHPAIHPDGSVLDQPGYDPVTGIYFGRGDACFRAVVCPRASASGNGDPADTPEEAKGLFAVLTEGTPVGVIENNERPLGSGALRTTGPKMCTARVGREPDRNRVGMHDVRVQR